jgi:hypothetical protein
MMVVNIIFGVTLGLIFLIRLYKWRVLVKSISKLCYNYDKKYMTEHNEALIEKLTTNKYHLKCEWSAYKFLFFDGPNPIGYLFSFKKLDIYNIYDNEIIDKVKNFETKRSIQ